MLAKNVNNNACFLNERCACKFFASKLAPTDGGVRLTDWYQGKHPPPSFQARTRSTTPIPIEHLSLPQVHVKESNGSEGCSSCISLT
ncbi:hypothetical protein EUX53_05525 [Pseudomonas orientalis]|nr:hypothetical protein EUX53_05525 [Pseudomonas orientalis]